MATRARGGGVGGPEAAARGSHVWLWRWAWRLLLLARLALCALSRGYVHPDEFFQGVEVAAGDALALRHGVAWEWARRSALRSLASRALQCDAPLRLLAALVGRPGPRAVLLAPRAAAWGLSLALDAAVVALSAVEERGGARLALAALWPVLLLAARPTSNAAEALLLALLLWLCCAAPCARRGALAAQVALGALGAFGTFARPTFVAFAAGPVAVRALAMWGAAEIEEQDVRVSSPREVKRTARGSGYGREPRGEKSRAGFSFVALWAVAAASAGLMAAMLVAADSWYYGGEEVVVAPLRFVRYNAAHAAEHGAHPRWLHLVVNVPLLFGPLAPAALWKAVSVLSGRLRPAAVAATTAAQRARLASALTILVSLAVLSAAPHQEPRFLLPLAVPVALLGGSALARSRALLGAHAIFHAALTACFCLHQAGVVPALLRASGPAAAAADANACLAVATIGTFMPPLSLLGLPGGAVPLTLGKDIISCEGGVCVVDVGEDLASDWLERVMALPTEHSPECTFTAGQCVALLAAPARFDDAVAEAARELGMDAQAQAWWPHLDTDNPPSSLGEAVLRLYCVRAPQ